MSLYAGNAGWTPGGTDIAAAGTNTCCSILDGRGSVIRQSSGAGNAL